MRLLVSCESWSLTYNNGRGANGGEYSDMSVEYVEHLKACFEEDYNEKVEIVYVDEEEKPTNLLSSEIKIQRSTNETH